VTDYTGLGRSQLLELLEKSERMRAAVARDRESALQAVDAATAQRDDARICARALAFCWDHDTRPPEDILTTARQWDAYGQVIGDSKTSETPKTA
jgi:hypothetical protein